MILEKENDDHFMKKIVLFCIWNNSMHDVLFVATYIIFLYDLTPVYCESIPQKTRESKK